MKLGTFLKSPSAPAFPALLVLLNAVPVYGVFAWGWQSFDLIFLYWFENLVIGAFMIARMLIRPYSHIIELVFPLLLVPFFLLHYGMFCYVHGSFVFSLFAENLPYASGPFEMLGLAFDLLRNSQQHLMVAAIALVILQFLDWVRDSMTLGLGGQGIKQLTIGPYRRIVVLHLALIASGFTLGALDEPVIGLLLLVVLKTAFDIYAWHTDEEAATRTPIDVTPEKLAELAREYPTPTVTINGKEHHFDSFKAMKRSTHWGMMQALLRFMGAGRELRALNTYMDARVAEERSQRSE